MNTLRGFLFFSLAASVACVPIPMPRTLTLSPQIEGRIYLDDEPLKEQRITVHMQSFGGCNEPIAEDVTEDDGSFSIPEVTRDDFFAMFNLLPVHKIYQVEICVESASRAKHPIWSATRYTLYDEGIGPLPGQFDLRCQLTEEWDALEADKIKPGEQLYCSESP